VPNALDTVINRHAPGRHAPLSPEEIQIIRAACLQAVPGLTDEEITLGIEFIRFPQKVTHPRKFFTNVLPGILRTREFGRELEKFRNIRTQMETQGHSDYCPDCDGHGFVSRVTRGIAASARCTSCDGTGKRGGE
jgi:hypothetical protein